MRVHLPLPSSCCYSIVAVALAGVIATVLAPVVALAAAIRVAVELDPVMVSGPAAVAIAIVLVRDVVVVEAVVALELGVGFLNQTPLLFFLVCHI